MKGLFKKIAVLLAMFILAAEITTVMQEENVSAASIESTASSAKKAYKNYVWKYLSSSTDYPGSRYKFYDINRDGIPEMLFSYASGVRCGYKIYTYKKGKIIKMLDEIGAGGIYRNAKKKEIYISFSSGAADNWVIFYKMKNKKLVQTQKYHNRDSSQFQGKPLQFY